MCSEKTEAEQRQKTNASSACLLLCSAHPSLNLKRGGGFASHCVSLVWGVPFSLVRTSGRGFRHGKSMHALVGSGTSGESPRQPYRNASCFFGKG